MDERETLRLKQMIWEMVSPLMDRLDELKQEVGDLRHQVRTFETQLGRAPDPNTPLGALPPGDGEGV